MSQETHRQQEGHIGWRDSLTTFFVWSGWVGFGGFSLVALTISAFRVREQDCLSWLSVATGFGALCLAHAIFLRQRNDGLTQFDEVYKQFEIVLGEFKQISLIAHGAVNLTAEEAINQVTAWLLSTQITHMIVLSKDTAAPAFWENPGAAISLSLHAKRAVMRKDRPLEFVMMVCENNDFDERRVQFGVSPSQRREEIFRSVIPEGEDRDWIQVVEHNEMLYNQTIATYKTLNEGDRQRYKFIGKGEFGPHASIVLVTIESTHGPRRDLIVYLSEGDGDAAQNKSIFRTSNDDLIDLLLLDSKTQKLIRDATGAKK